MKQTLRNIYILVIIFCIIFNIYPQENLAADFIVYSYNRPLQLVAFLESLNKYAKNIGKIFVIYRSNNDFSVAYKNVEKEYSQCKFIKQSENPREDFKPLTMQTIESCSEYIIFSVDDIVVKDNFDISRCISALQKTNAYGFYLRLGKNIGKSPELEKVEDDIYKWQFKSGADYWDYPNCLDMTLYSKSAIKEQIENIPFNSPNTFEGEWAKKPDLEKFGLCFEVSKMVNLNFNVVQEDWGYLVQHNNNLDIYNLLKKFNNGERLNFEPLYQINNNSAHLSNFVPVFKKAG